MANQRTLRELVVTMDPSSYEAGAKRVEAADDAVATSAEKMGAAVAQSGQAVDAAGARISQTDQRVSASVSSFERMERSLRTSSGTAQLYEQAITRVNAVTAKHPELAERAAAVQEALANRYLGTGRAAAESAAMQAAADAKVAQSAAERQRVVDTARAAQSAQNSQQSVNTLLNVREPAQFSGSAAGSASVFLEAGKAQEQEAAAMAQLAAEAQRVRDGLDPAAAAQRRYAQAISELDALKSAGALSGTDYVAAVAREGAALDRTRGEAAALAGALTSGTGATVTHAGALKNLGGAYEETSVHAGALVRESRAVFDELSSGRSQQAIGSITLLLTRGLGIGFGPLAAGLAALAIPAATVLSTIRYQESLKQLDLDLATTGRSIGLSRDALLDLGAATARASSLTSGEGRGIVESLAATGNVGTASIAKAAALSRDFGAALGKDATEGAAELGKALENPSQALDDLNKRFGISNVSLIEYVRNAQAQGDVEGARVAVLDALAPKVQDLAENKLIALQRVWTAVGDAASDAYDKMGQLGSDGTLTTRIAALTKAVAAEQAAASAPVPTTGNATDDAFMRQQHGRATAMNRQDPDDISKELALEDALEQQRRQGALAAERMFTAQQDLANQAPDLAAKYDTFGKATNDLNNAQIKLGRTLDAMRATNQAVGPVFDTLTRSYQDNAATLALRSGVTDHSLNLQDIQDRSAALDASPGRRSLISARSGINTESTRSEIAPDSHVSDLEAERTAKLALATKEYTTSIADETAAILARTNATAAYASAIGGKNLSPDQALTAGYVQQAQSAGADASRTRGLDAGTVAQAQLRDQSAQGLAQVTEATLRLRQETDLLSTSDNSNAAATAAANRERETMALFSPALQKAAADEAEAWQRGDLARVASAQRVTDAINDQKAAYTSAATDRDGFRAHDQGNQISGDLQDQLTVAQTTQDLEPQTHGSKSDQVDAARQIAELQERLALTKQFGPELDEQDQANVKLAGDIAAVTEQTRLMGQEQKGAGKAIDEIGSAGLAAFERLSTATGSWHDKMHSALQTVEQDVAKIIENLYIMKPLTQALGGGQNGASGSGLSGVVGGLFNSLFGGPSTAEAFSGADTASSLSDSLPDAGAGANLGAAAEIPGFAAGGDPPVNQPSIVGEDGPELFMPKSAGTIVPAPQTSAMLGGGGGNHFEMHFHGGSNGLSYAEVQHMITQAAPSMIKAASSHAQGQVFSAIQRGGSAAKISGRRPPS